MSDSEDYWADVVIMPQDTIKAHLSDNRRYVVIKEVRLSIGEEDQEISIKVGEVPALVEALMHLAQEAQR